MNKQITVFGSLNMDFSIQIEQLPEQGQTIAGEEFFSCVGGKGANQALAAARSKVATQMIGAVGKDAFANTLLDTLAKSSVDTKRIKEIEHTPSGMALILRSQGDNRIIINHGANYAITASEITTILESCINNEHIFITQNECLKGATTAALKTAKKQGACTIYNPAPARECEDFCGVDYLILNESECEFFTKIVPNDAASIAKCAQILLAKNAQNIIITLGSAGCVLVNKSGVLKFSAYKVSAIDTTAAGDTFIGAFAAALASGDEVASAIDYASRAAALCVMRLGAASSIPTHEEIISYKGSK